MADFQATQASPLPSRRRQGHIRARIFVDDEAQGSDSVMSESDGPDVWEFTCLSFVQVCEAAFSIDVVTSRARVIFELGTHEMKCCKLQVQAEIMVYLSTTHV